MSGGIALGDVQKIDGTVFDNKGNGCLHDFGRMSIREVLGLRNAQNIEIPYAVEKSKALKKGRYAFDLSRSDADHPNGLSFIVKEPLVQWKERASVVSPPYSFSNAAHVLTCSGDDLDPLGNEPMMAAVEVEAGSIAEGGRTVWE